MGVLHCCIARLLWGAMGSRSNAIMSIRRGHELIHVFNHKTADDYLFHPADGQNQKVDCKIFSLATGVLDLLASHLGTDYKGLGQALKDHRRSVSPEVAKLVRGLHEAFGFVRHLTQVGEERILEAVRADLAASCPDPAATATAPCRSATTTPSARRTLCLERLLSPSSTPDCVFACDGSWEPLPDSNALPLQSKSTQEDPSADDARSVCSLSDLAFPANLNVPTPPEHGSMHDSHHAPVPPPLIQRTSSQHCVDDDGDRPATKGDVLRFLQLLEQDGAVTAAGAEQDALGATTNAPTGAIRGADKE